MTDSLPLAASLLQAATLAVPSTVWTFGVATLAGAVTAFVTLKVTTNLRLIYLEKELRTVQKGLAMELSRLSNRIDADAVERRALRQTLTDIHITLAEMRGAERERAKRERDDRDEL